MNQIPFIAIVSLLLGAVPASASIVIDSSTPLGLGIDSLFGVDSGDGSAWNPYRLNESIAVQDDGAPAAVSITDRTEFFLIEGWQQQMNRPLIHVFGPATLSIINSSISPGLEEPFPVAVLRDHNIVAGGTHVRLVDSSFEAGVGKRLFHIDNSNLSVLRSSFDGHREGSLCFKILGSSATFDEVEFLGGCNWHADGFGDCRNAISKLHLMDSQVEVRGSQTIFESGLLSGIGTVLRITSSSITSSAYNDVGLPYLICLDGDSQFLLEHSDLRNSEGAGLSLYLGPLANLTAINSRIVDANLVTPFRTTISNANLMNSTIQFRKMTIQGSSTIIDSKLEIDSLPAQAVAIDHKGGELKISNSRISREDSREGGVVLQTNGRAEILHSSLPPGKLVGSIQLIDVDVEAENTSMVGASVGLCLLGIARSIAGRNRQFR